MSNDKEQIKIKIIGVGGGASNIIDYMINNNIKNVEFIVTDTDLQSLNTSVAPYKIQLGLNTLKGQNAGMEPSSGREAAAESFEEIKVILKGSDIVLIIAGLGGGTGTGAVPFIAKAAKEVGAFVIPIVTCPFKFEGRKRRRLAIKGLEELKIECNSVIVIPTENILNIAAKSLSIKETFEIIDKLITQIASSITKAILLDEKNDLNLDFADLKILLNHKSIALSGTGQATSINAASDALNVAIKSPLLDNISINEARGLFVHFEVHPDYHIMNVSLAIKIIEKTVHEDASIILSITTNDKIDSKEVRVTIIAAGFSDDTKLQSCAELKEPLHLLVDNDFDVPALLRK